MRFSSSQSFSVFPDANFLKILIFRRLNTQKYLLTSQLDAKGYERGYLFKPQLTDFDYSNRLNFSATIHRPLHPKFVVSTFRQTTSYLGVQMVPISKYTRIRRIKFKPGYNRL